LSANQTTSFFFVPLWVRDTDILRNFLTDYLNQVSYRTLGPVREFTPRINCHIAITVEDDEV
jgi:hypothetical protein